MKVTDNHCEMKNNFWRVSLASLREARGQAGIPGEGGVSDAADIAVSSRWGEGRGGMSLVNS